VRSLVGLDRAAAKRAFDTFIEGRKLTAHRHEFVDMVIDRLRPAGIISKHTHGERDERPPLNRYGLGVKMAMSQET
jgi:type I restriction enzyme R subunit